MYSLEVPQTGTSTTTPIRRHPNPNTSPQFAVKGCRTLYEVLRRGQSISPLGPCMGYRAVSTTDGAATPYIYSSYTEIVTRVDAIAAGLEKLGIVERNEDGLLLVRLHNTY